MLHKRKPNFLSGPLLWTVPVQYTAASLSHSLTNESLHVQALKRLSPLRLNLYLEIENERWMDKNGFFTLIVLFLWITADFLKITSCYLMENGQKRIWQNMAGLHGGSLSNPANSWGGEDGGGRLARVYNAGMDLRLSRDLQGSALRGRSRICGFMKKMALTGGKC